MIDSTSARNALDAISAPDRADAIRDTIRDLLMTTRTERDADAAELAAALDIDDTISTRTLDAIRTLINAIDDSIFADPMTQLRLDYSLCPMHAIDYAICFDDDDPECAAIRTIHNAHDT